MTERRAWDRDEQLAAFCLYCRTPFGKLHARNPEIIALALRLGRTASAVAMKAFPWSVNESRRADPRNGVCLNSLYDKAFDRGLLTLTDDLKVVVSPVLRVGHPSEFHRWALLDIEGAIFNSPARFAPDPVSLAFHREHIFQRA